MFKSRKGFLLLYAVIWVIVLTSPYFRYMQDIGPNGWNRMIGDWTNLFLLLLLFLVNIFLLVPRLLFNDKRSQYFFIVTVMIFAVSVISLIFHPIGPPQPSGMGIPPPEIQYNLLPFLGTILNNLIAALLIIGSSTAFELEFKWRSEQQLRKDAEKEQLKTNLALLRHQVSPHFFMNTLNNIHALIDINTEHAKDAIVRLSTLMRYLLYDSAQGTIALKKEIEFINSFVSLMQLRYSDQVDIQVKMPEHIPDIHIPPMLFVSFLENAFKHGVSYQSKSFIHFELKMQTNNLFCSIKNSKHNAHTSQDGEYMGIGMENIKKSLQLLFRDNYSLNIADNQNSFEVDLTIPL
jgi:sensor histidine kinase YesM